MKKIVLGIILGVFFIGSFFLLDKKSDKKENKISTPEVVIEKVEKSKEEKLLTGKWQSLDDSFFIRNFDEDQTFQDLYEGEGLTSSGTWFVFDSNSKPEYFPYPVESEKKYLIMNDTNLSLNFIISEIDNDSLDLIYLDNGGILRFTRI